MSTAITQVNTAAGGDIWQVALDRLNQLINAVSTVVVTSAANSSGGVTQGNVHVNGYLSGTLVAANTLRGGNVETSNVLTITSNVNIATGSYLSIGNSSVNATMNSSTLTIPNANVGNLVATNISFAAFALSNVSYAYVTTTAIGFTPQPVDFFLLSAGRAAEYTFSLKDNTANAHQVTKMTIIQTDTDYSIMEYGTVSSNGSLGTFDATMNSTALSVVFTPINGNVSIKGLRTLYAP